MRLRNLYRESCFFWINLFVFITATTSLTYCGHKSKDPKSDPAFVQSVDQLNKRDYEGAISTLKGLESKYPNSPEVKKKLMHALAGAAGFDAPNFRKTVKNLMDTNLSSDISEEYRQFTAKLREDLKRNVKYRSAKEIDQEIRRQWKRLEQQRFVKIFNEWFQQAPDLNTHQAERLNEAIRIYEELGLSYATSSKDDNFQWASIYTYRLLANLKDVFRTLDDLINDRSVANGQDLEAYFVAKYRLIVDDGFMAYKLFKHSYDRLRLAAEKFEEALEKVSGKRLKAKLLSEAKDTKEFIKDLVYENKDMASELITRIEDRIKQDDFYGSLKSIFSEFIEEGPEYRYRKDRIKAIVNVFIDDMKMRYAREYQEAESIVTQKFLDEVEATYDQVVATGSLTPFWQFYKDRKSELRRLIEAAEIVVREARDQDLDESLRPHIQALRDRVDDEQLRLVRERAKLAKTDINGMLTDERELLQSMEAYTKSRIDERLSQGEAAAKKSYDENINPISKAYGEPDPQMDEQANKQRQKAVDYMRRKE